MSGTPQRLRSTKLLFSVEEWMFLPASSSMWMRVTPMVFLPAEVSISTRPCSHSGCSYWLIW